MPAGRAVASGSTPSPSRCASRRTTRPPTSGSALVELTRERVVLHRAVRGIKMAVDLPVAAYLGVAIRMEPPAGHRPGRSHHRARASRPCALARTLSRGRRRRHRRRMAVVGPGAERTAACGGGRRPFARSRSNVSARCRSPSRTPGGGGARRSKRAGRQFSCAGVRGNAGAGRPCTATSARSSRATDPKIGAGRARAIRQAGTYPGRDGKSESDLRSSALPLPLRDLDQLGQFGLAQRRGDELKADCIGHHLVDAGNAIGADRRRRQEFLQRALGGRLGQLGESRIGLPAPRASNRSRRANRDSHA